MNKVVLIIVFGLVISSCATQEKTVELASGKMVTQKKYNKMLDKAFKTADRDARKSVKGNLNKKEIKEFRNNINVTLDTLN